MTLKAADHYPNFSSDAFEIQINGKLIFSKTQLGHFPDMAEMVEIIGTLHEIEGVSKVTGVLPTSEYLGFFPGFSTHQS